MTTKTKHNAKPSPSGTDLLAGIPAPPDGWLPSEFNDPHGAWVQGRAQVEADEADTSGADKGLRAVRPLAWAVHVVGGSIRTWLQRLAEAEHARDQAAGRIIALKAKGLPIEEAQREKAAADRNVEARAVLVAAAETWPGPDNVTLRARLEEATQSHEARAARITPYRRARLPYPPEWDQELYESEREVTSAAAAFNAGRARLDALAEALRDATAAARMALAGSLGNVAERCGQACARIVHEADAEFLAAFPNRAPDDLIVLYSRAGIVNDIMARLGVAPDAGMSRFFLACGESVRDIVAAKVAAGRNFHESGMRPKEPHPDALMNETF